MPAFKKGQKSVAEVCVGPDLNHLKPVEVNDDANPTTIQSEEFDGRLVVRIKGFDGFSPKGQIISSSPYFDKVSRLFSIEIQGKFKRDWKVDDLMWGVEFETKQKVPFGASAALKFIQYTIDPCLEADFYADKPWARSSLFTAMNTFKIEPSVDGSLPPWPSPNGEHMVEDTFSAFGRKMDTSARRKFFTKPENRMCTTIKSTDIISMDFFNPILDFSNFKVRVPAVGLSINMLKYYNGEPLRYTCKSRDNSVTFFVIQIDLKPIVTEILSAP